MIRSLILQLWNQSIGVPAPLAQICGHGHQQPSIASLQLTLRQIIETFERTYIILDALDECMDREKLLAWTGDLLRRETGKVHILLSSRRELDIEDCFESIPNLVHVPLRGGSLNADIEKYIDAMLSKITKWDGPTRARVREVLIQGAHGM